MCVGPDELSERVVRAARRQAAALYAPWVAVYVETPRLTRLDETARDRVLATLKLAESLGAETANLSGESVAAELIGFARTRNVSKILVGKPLRPRWRDRLRPGLVDELIRLSGTIDVYVVSGEAGEARPPAPLDIHTPAPAPEADAAAAISAPTMMTEEMALVTAISGVCRAGVTLHTT